jgi:hypothetical protein
MIAEEKQQMELTFRRGLHEQHGKYIAPVVATLTLETAKLTGDELKSNID